MNLNATIELFAIGHTADMILDQARSIWLDDVEFWALVHREVRKFANPQDPSPEWNALSEEQKSKVAYALLKKANERKMDRDTRTMALRGI
jgi:hypothetical protein